MFIPKYQCDLLGQIKLIEGFRFLVEPCRVDPKALRSKSGIALADRLEPAPLNPLSGARGALFADLRESIDIIKKLDFPDAGSVA